MVSAALLALISAAATAGFVQQQVLLRVPVAFEESGHSSTLLLHKGQSFIEVRHRTVEAMLTCCGGWQRLLLHSLT
jgi:hypothetical protein